MLVVRIVLEKWVFSQLEYSSFTLMGTVTSEALRCSLILQNNVVTELLPWVIPTSVLALMSPSVGRDGEEDTWQIPA